MDAAVDRLAASLAASQDFTGWLPIRLYVAEGTVWVDWCYRGDTRFEAGFFQHDIDVLLRSPFNQAFRRYTPIADMVTWAQRGAIGTGHAPLQALIAHVSRCGSTLVAQCLAHQATHVVMSEPPLLDTLLDIHGTLPDVTREQHIIWLRALVYALGQTPGNEQHLVIKLDAWHVLQHELLSAAFPGVPWLFIYRDPIEIAVSQFESRASYMVPGLQPALTRVAPAAEASAMGTDAHIAHVLGKFFAAGALLCERGDARAVNYTELPGLMWDELLPYFGLTADGATLASLQATATRHAKRPTETFTPDTAGKQQRASAKLRAAVSLHCAASYNRLLAVRDTQP